MGKSPTDVVSYDDLVAAVDAERVRRLTTPGFVYHYWRERGDAEPPQTEHWCVYCAGFFGVPHDTHHELNNGMCREVTRSHQCACIDCVVAVQIGYMRMRG